MRVAAARLLLVLRAAVVAGELADDVVLVGAPVAACPGSGGAGPRGRPSAGGRCRPRWRARCSAACAAACCENRNWSQQSARLSCSCAVWCWRSIARMSLSILGRISRPWPVPCSLGHQPLLELQTDVAHALAAVGGNLALALTLRRRLLSRRRLPRGERRTHGRAIERLAPPRLGLRPRPPAPALRQRVGDGQAERDRGQRRDRRQAHPRPSGSAFTHWKIPSLAEPRGAGRCRTFRRGLWECDIGRSMQRKCGAGACPQCSPP